jgi:hypothetical protein
LPTTGLLPPSAPRRGEKLAWTERAGAWLSEEALTGLLILLVVDMLVLPTLGLRVGHLALNIVFTVLLLTGLAAVANRGLALVFGGLLVLATVILKWMAAVTSLAGVRVTAGAVSLATVALFTLLVFVRTLSPGPITRHRIEGAVATYLLVGMAFALAYVLIEVVSPGSFQLAEGATELQEHTLGYFSIVTLTTVGYGDMTPLSPLARRLAAFEGLIGQLYPAIIIGWMVSSMKTRRAD